MYVVDTSSLVVGGWSVRDGERCTSGVALQGAHHFPCERLVVFEDEEVFGQECDVAVYGLHLESCSECHIHTLWV